MPDIQYPKSIYKPYKVVKRDIGGVTHYAAATKSLWCWHPVKSDEHIGCKTYAGRVWHTTEQAATDAIWCERRREERNWLQAERGGY